LQLFYVYARRQQDADEQIDSTVAEVAEVVGGRKEDEPGGEQQDAPGAKRFKPG
jgi:hypothetical protein